MSAVSDLLRAAEAAGVRLEARLWCDAPDRLDPALRDALAAERLAVLRLLLDAQVDGGEPAGCGEGPWPELRWDQVPSEATVAGLLAGYRRHSGEPP